MMSEQPIAFDSILDTCQNQHRRIVLKMLIEEQRALTLDELTKAILKYNHHTPPTEASEDVVTEIHNSLYYVHLPKLASEGFINYDREHEFVKPSVYLDRVQMTLSSILDADPSLKTADEAVV